MEDILRDVNVEGYRLTTYATTGRDSRGQTTIGYRFHGRDGKVIFAGEDFHGSPMHADDSDATLRALLGFLTLRPGDTDREYFEGYTPEQMAFARGDAERLSMWSFEPGDEFERLEFVDWENGE